MCRLDYFAQRRAYRDYKMYERKLSQAQNDLYRELLDYANDKRRLDVPFRLMNDAVLKLTGLSESTMADARNRLAQYGLIKYDKGKRNTDTPIYQIINLYEDRANLRDDSVDDAVVTSGNDTGGSSVDDTGTNLITTTQHNLTSNNHDRHDDSLKQLFEIYSQEIGVIGPTAKQLVFDSIKDFTDQGTKEDEANQIVIHAIKIMAENNAKSWKYVQAILNNWLSHSLFDLDNIKAYQTKSRKPKQNYGKYNQKPKETGTDWDKVKAKETSNSSNDLQDRLAKIRGKQDATS